MKRPQFTLRALLVAASFFAGVFSSRKEAIELRRSLKVQQESEALTAKMMRGVVAKLEEAKIRIKELQGQ